MSRRRLIRVVGCLFLGLLSACAASGGPRGAATGTPTPSATSYPTPTLAVPTRDVTFITADHLTLPGTLFGGGARGVIFSNQIDGNLTDWSGTAQQFAAYGFLALTYNYRGGFGSQGRFDVAHFTDDLQAAVVFLRAQGARSIVLIGASIGGAVTLRAAGGVRVDALATLSAPADFQGEEVSDDLLRRLTLPKLFVNSQYDTYAAATQHMYDVAPPPKILQMYPGGSHGVAILDREYGADLLQRLLAFATLHSA